MRNNPCPNHPARLQHGDTGVCLVCFRTEQFTAPAPDPVEECRALAEFGVTKLRKLAKERSIQLPPKGAPALELAAAILGIDTPADPPADEPAPAPAEEPAEPPADRPAKPTSTRRRPGG